MNLSSSLSAKDVVPAPVPMPPPVIRVADIRADEKPVAVAAAEEVVGENALFRRVRTCFTFTNPNARQMAGEFEFPIPEGSFVCGYSLEIGGAMVPGVVCAKEKARVAFENEVRKGVDPGMVEQVRGNVWRTRIFPLDPGTPRRAEVERMEPKPTDNAPAVIYERDGGDVFAATVGAAASAKSARDAIAAFEKGVVLWDASGSAAEAASGWRAKLGALPESGEWQLVVFRNVPEPPRAFTGKRELLAALDALAYDGGTDIGAAVSCAARTGAPVLLFTDEVDTLGLDAPKYEDLPNVVVASRPDAPARAVEVRKLASGECAPDGAAVAESTMLATVWASRRMQDLASQADARRDEFLALGRKYGVAGPGLSLIVLESLQQYIDNKIEPPRSMPFHGEWVKLASAQDDEISKKEADAEHERDLLKLWKERVEWWNNPVPPKPTPRSGLFDGAADMATEGRFRRSGAMRMAAQRSVAAASMPADGDAPGLEEESESQLAMAAAPQEKANAVARPQAGGGGATITVAAWDPKAPYLDAMRKASDACAEYLVQRKEHGAAPAFYMDCASFFFKKGDAAFAWRVLSNMAEFRLDDAAVWRSMGWRLREAGCREAAVLCFRKALALRGEEGQSRRDLALVLSELGKERRDAALLGEAMALLREAAFTNWARRSGRRSNDRQVSIVALEEFNALAAWCKAADVAAEVPEIGSAYRRDLPVKIRIVLSWDADATDIDLHVLEPDGEEAFYGHRRTSTGGFVSEDVTTGYGPEEYLRKEGAGKFRILTNYFASHQASLTGAATVTATVYTDWGTAAEQMRILTLRLDKPKDKLIVGEVEVAE